MNENKNVRIGDLLKQYGYANEAQIEQALAYQREHSELRLGDAMVEMGFITEKQLLAALEKHFSLRLVDITEIPVDINAVRKIPRNIAEKYNLLAIGMNNDVLLVVLSDPTNFYALEEVRQITGMTLEIELCEKEPLRRAIRYNYSEIDAKIAAAVANENIEKTVEQIQATSGDDDTPVIQLIDSLIRRAYSSGASDIHIEPFEDKTQIRMRVDGTITEFVTIQKSIHASLIARLKILSDLDIAEKRIPQDGHFRFSIDGIAVNIRVSMIPTVFGEKAVLRLLATNTTISNNSTFGMIPEDFRVFSKMLHAPNGIIYITGPTGSGKSTTLYMVLEELAKRHVNISTIEDPVEKNVFKINQMQVNNVSGLTFGIGLRALLRQDPDIIMVGETRDSETASISVRAAITGHLVLSTLHTNDAASSIVRLEDMGVKRYLIASSVVGIVAQRLMKRLCPYCSEEVETTEFDREYLGQDCKKIRRAVGCHNCNNTGYVGRMAIHEILVVDRTLRDMISKGSTTEEIRDYAVKEQGLKLLGENGADLVRRGITTMEELMKVAYYT